MDFAKRAYDHSFHIDPIVRSLMDTDFYKLLMLQVIWKHYREAEVSFAVTNRTKDVRLTGIISQHELRAQLDHVKGLRFREEELIWLRGQTFYGQRGIFCEEFIDFLRTLKLSEYELYEERDVGAQTHGSPDPPTGQFVLRFHGPWVETTLWEIYALTIVNTLRYRKIMSGMKRSQLDIMYARAKVKLYEKLEVLAGVEDLNITDFGTRRRHDFLWQEHCVLTAKEVLGDRFTGTSNAYLAMRHGLDTKGTNAHELPMALAAMTMAEWGNSPDYDDRLRDAQYEVLRVWEKTYDGALRVFLPDTFGTTQFLKNAPKFVNDWVGARPDSKKPIPAGEELIDWWTARGQNPQEKLIIFSDGLDVALSNLRANGEDIVAIANHFRGRVRVGFGWGTNLTNDFIGCPPGDAKLMKPISLVCKVEKANNRPAVKLSDNFTKATGPKEEVDLYKGVFGHEGMDNAPVVV